MFDTHDRTHKTFPGRDHAGAVRHVLRAVRAGRSRQGVVVPAAPRRLRGGAGVLLQHGPERGCRAARARAGRAPVRPDHRSDDRHAGETFSSCRARDEVRAGHAHDPTTPPTPPPGFLTLVNETTRRALASLPVRHAPPSVQAWRRGDEVEGATVTAGGGTCLPPRAGGAGGHALSCGARTDVHPRAHGGLPP